MPLRQKILLGILVAVVGFYAYTKFVPEISLPEIPVRGGGTPGQQQQRDRLQTAGDTTSGNLRIPVTLKWDRDPFYREKAQVTGGEGGDPMENLILTGIQGNVRNFIVTINGERYRKGEFIDRTKQVITIGNNYVVIRERGEEHVLRMRKK